MAAAKPNPVPGYPPNYASISNPAIPSGLQLLQAHVYFRHGERTPVKQRLTHLGIPDRWNLCTAGKEFAAGVINDPDGSGSLSGPSTSSASRRKKQNSELMLIKKQVEVGGQGSAPRPAEPSECAWGELTDLGRLSTLRLGKQLRTRYVDKLGFLPKIITEADADAVYMRSTGVPRAFESMQQVLHGIYPAQDASHVPVIATRAFDEDPILPTSGCATAKAIDMQYKKAAAEKYNHVLEPLDSKIAELVGVPVRIDSHPSANGVFDTIKAAQAHSIPVPKIFEDPTVSSTMERAIVHEWFSAYASRQFTRLVMGRLFAEMNTRMDDSVAGRSGLKLGLYGCHDTSVAGILHGLKVFDGKWPAFTAYVAVELFKKEGAKQPSENKGWLASIMGGGKSENDHYVRVRYDDRDVHIPACAPPGKHLEGSNGAVCTFEAFKEAVKDISLTREEWSKACKLPLAPETTA